MIKTCGDCIHADICKEVNGGWFSPKNPAYCKLFKDTDAPSEPSGNSEQFKWISVEDDELPTKNRKCLVYRVYSFTGGYVSIATFTPCYEGLPGDPMNGKQIWYEYDGEYGDYEISDITHWMPLPEPPKED